MIFVLVLSEGMENCKMTEKSGKSQGILKWMISGNPAEVTLKSIRYLMCNVLRVLFSLYKYTF